MTRNEILDKIYILEHEKMEYLEVDDKRNANRKRRQIEKLQKELDILEAKRIIEENKLLKTFIAKRNLNSEYVKFAESVTNE